MDNKDQENKPLKLSAAAVFTRNVATIRNTFADITREISDINEISPSDILVLTTGLVNVFNAGIRAADVPEQYEDDAGIYMDIMLYDHEGLVDILRNYEPDESQFATNEDDIRAYSLFKEINQSILRFFDTCYERYNTEEAIDLEFYEKELAKLNMDINSHKDMKLHLSNIDFHYDNVCKEDIEAVLKMSAEMGLPELHECDVAEAVASHINSLLTDGRTTKDLDSLDIMAECIGCKIINESDFRAQLQEFIEGYINRDKKLNGNAKYNKSKEAAGTLFVKVPSYKLPNNRMLVFEPNGISSSVPKQEEEKFREHIEKEVLDGLNALLRFTPEEQISKSVKDFLSGKEPSDSENAKQVYKDLISWLAPWAGRPANFPDGFRAAGITDVEQLKNVDLGAWEGSCIYSAIEKHLATEGHVDIPTGIIIVIGIMHAVGPHGLIEQIVTNKITPAGVAEAFSTFKEDIEKHGYMTEEIFEKQILRIRLKK